MNSSFNGRRLKEARLYNKLTITELAEKLNITKQMISKYENGIK
ncbi:TPA: helix-turn-helix transcriptional regulator, partial [Staphylococcus pseudintermedius]|nr:helix-turn-helix transcriptional regulator [Staphylococcus pseudintermedius]